MFTWSRVKYECKNRTSLFINCIEGPVAGKALPRKSHWKKAGNLLYPLTCGTFPAKNQFSNYFAPQARVFKCSDRNHLEISWMFEHEQFTAVDQAWERLARASGLLRNTSSYNQAWYRNTGAVVYGCPGTKSPRMTKLETNLIRLLFYSCFRLSYSAGSKRAHLDVFLF